MRMGTVNAAVKMQPRPRVRLAATPATAFVRHLRASSVPLPEPPERFVPAQRRLQGIEPLALDEESTLHLARLPRLHRDPFDRMLVCQAIVHGLVILGPDPAITQYPVRAAW
jgi:PIN domain nuclease of toxin-antitoxin system